MIYDRDTVLKDLRSYVIEFSFNNKSFRGTLRPDLLPPYPLYNESEEKEYNNNKNNNLVVWDVGKKTYQFIDIKDINYLQIIDGY